MRKNKRRPQPARRLRFVRLMGLERLEDRTLLDASNVFAQFSGQLLHPNDTEHIPIQLTSTNFTIPASGVVLGFEAQTSSGSSLDPADVQISNAAGATMPLRYGSPDYTGNTQSVVLAALPAGNYTLTVAGNRGTVGGFKLDVFLAGDVDGDHTVTTTDGKIITSLIGSKAGDGKYQVSADSNLDGVISSFDYTQWRANVGASTLLRTLGITETLPAGLYLLPDGTPVTANSTITVSGTTNAGATVALETGSDSNFDEGQTTANSLGAYSFTTSLVAGANTLQVRATDSFGQQAFAAVKVDLDTQAPTVTLTSPTSPLTTNTNITLTGQVTDNLSGTASLEASVDNGAYQPVSFDAQGHFSFTTALALDSSADGLHTVQLRATDHVGNVSSPLAYTFTLDTVAPVVTVSSPSSGLTFRSNPTLVGQVTDALSGVASVQAAVDNGSYQAVSFDAQGHFSFTPSLLLDGSADGLHTVYLRATDNAGNVSTPVAFTFTLDTVAPVVTVNSPSSGLTFRSNPTLTGQVTDALSGVASLQAAVDNGTYQAVSFDAQGNFTFLTALLLDGSADGTHTVYLRATDKAGNVSMPVAFTFTLDTISPVVSISNPSPGLTFATNPTLTGQVSDNGSGVASLLVAVDNGSFAPLSFDAQGHFSFRPSLLVDGSADGSHLVHFQATDNAGNVSSPVDFPFSLDTTPPVVSISSPSPGLTFTTNPTLTGQASDNLAGVASLQESVDNGAYQPVSFDTQGHFSFTTPLALDGSADGQHTVRLRATDNVGNVSSPLAYSFTLDAVALSITLVLPSGLYQLPDGTPVTSSSTITVGGQTSPGVAVGLETGSDNNFDEGQTTANSSGAYTFTTTLQPGANTLRVEASDSFGQHAFASQNVDLDTQPPTVTLTSPSPGLTTNTNITLTGQVTDNLSGTASLQASVDNGAYQAVSFDTQGHFSFTTPLALDGSADGQHTVRLRATDNVGNVSSPLAYSFTLDTVAPVVTVSSPSSGLTFRSNPTLTGQVTDALSGVASLQAAVDNGAYQAVSFDAQGNFAYPTALLLDGSADGTHTVYLRATDQASNVSTPVAFTFTLDTTPPVISVSAPNPVTGLVTSQNVTIAGSVTDNLSGVASLQEALDGGSFSLVSLGSGGSFSFATTLPLDHSADGLHTVHLKATDNVGNVSFFDVSFTLKTTPSTLLVEGTPLLSSLDQTFTVPSAPSVLQFQYSNLHFDVPTNFMNDAFEASLTDDNGNSLVLPIAGSGDAFLNITASQSPVLSPNAQLNNGTVDVDLSHIAAGTQVHLHVRLIDNDNDSDTTVSSTSTSVEVTDAQVISEALNTPAAVTPAVPPAARSTSINFSALSDVTSSMTANYGETAWNQKTNVLTTNVTLTNSGTYAIDTPLIAVVEHLSDPSIRVRGADGLTPDGQPYYDFSNLVIGGKLTADETTGSRTLSFYDPNGVQFTYDLVVLSEVNQSPVITSTPNVQALVGKPYEYDVKASDADGDPVTFSLVTAPSSMSIDAKTGVISWSPQAADLGNTSVTVQADDGYGGSTQQSYTLAVIQPPPNQPPVFTSTPVVSANVNTPYQYQATAADSDQDSLTYSLAAGPQGMTIDPATGLVQWQPTADQVSLPAERSISLQLENLYQGQPFPGQTYEFTVSPTSPDTVQVPNWGGDGQWSVSVTETGPNNLEVVFRNTGPSGTHAGSPNLGLFTILGPTTYDITDVTLGPSSNNYQDVSRVGLSYNTFSYDFGGLPFGEGDFVTLDVTMAVSSVVRLQADDGRGGSAIQAYTVNVQQQPGNLSPVITSTPVTQYNLPPAGNPASGSVNPTSLNLTLGSGQTSDQTVSINLPESTPLILGNTISTNLTTPGEQDRYSFTLGSKSLLYFDSLTDNGAFSWTLTGPGGTVVSNRSFTNSDGQSISDPVLALPPGDYKLTVAGNGATTGAYSFRLLDLSQAQTLTVGTPVSGTLARTSSTAYQFQANAGDSYYFASQQDSNPDYWRLIDPYGNVLFGTGLSNDGGRVNLTATGTYTLLIEGDISDTGATPYGFEAYAVKDTTQALTLGSTVNGSLAAPSQQDKYTFTLAADSLLYFDSLTDNSNLLWILTGPAGTVVSNRSFTSSDGGSILGDPVLALPAGDYTLTVVGNGTTTGAYSFRLLDLSQAQTLTVGTPVSGSLDPASTTAYQFQANAGDSYYFASQQGSSPDYWRLIDPYGNVLFGTALSSDGGRINLTATGTYTLLVEGDISDTGATPYGFEAYAVKDTTQALTLGSTVNGSLAAPSQQDKYTFTLAGNSLLYFDALTDNDAFQWSLTGPDGTDVSNRSFTSSDGGRISGDPVLALPAGDYTLTVVGNGATTGAYSFHLLDLSQAQTLTVGTPVSGSLNPASTTAYQFQANAGDSYYFASQQGSSPDYWRLIDPYGNVLFGTSLNNDGGRINLTATDTYMLLVEGDISDTGPASYGFEAYAVTDTTQALTLGSTVNGSLAAPSQQDRYTFHLSADALLYFDALTDNDAFQWSLTGPAGTVVSNRPFTSSDGGSISDPVLTLPAGDYTLTVFGNGSTTGAYSFRLLDLSQAQTLTVGTPVSGTLNPASTTAYQFQDNAGDSYYFASQQGSYPDYWRLIDPYGNVLFATALNNDGGQVSLTATGSYTLLIEGDISDTAPVNYAFNVQFQGNVPPPAPSATPLSLGSTVNGDLTTPGQQDTYNFHLSANSLLYFDSLTNDGNLQWSLTGPAGTAVSGRVFNESDGASIGGDPVLSLPAGDYTLTVSSPSNATDSYSFRLLDLSQAQTLTVGTPVSGSLDPASTTAYQFQANAGDSYYFASQQGSSPDYWRLIDPYGNVLFGTGLGSDGGRVDLTGTGTYTLLIEGDISDTVSTSYGFEAYAVAHTPQSLTLGSTVNGSLAAPTQQDTYNFHLSGDSLLYFDALTDNGNLLWTLTGPAGTAVSNRSFIYSDGQNSPGDPVLALPAGDYTLTVGGNGTTTGAYSFRLLDLTQGQTLTVGTPVSGTLDPASTTAYQFQANAGDSYYFASQQGSRPDYWRLIDPYGNVLFGTYLDTDGGRVNLTATGTYTLLVEGDISDTVSTSYGFEAYAVTDTTQALTLSSTVNASLAAPSQQDIYTFTLSGDALLYFDSLTYNGAFSWTLTGPAGTAVSNRSFTSSDGPNISGDPVLALPAGDYTLTVVGLGQTTGAYSFRLLDLSQAQTLTVGTPVSGTLDPASTTAYQFQANAGDSYYFASQQGSSPDYWRLIDPYGNVLFGTILNNNGGRVNLTATGTYTLLIEGAISDTVSTSYGFEAFAVTDTTQALPLGNTVNGLLAAPTQQDSYTFHLSGDSLLYFDSLTENNNFNWTLTGPAGTAVSNRSFTSSDGGNIFGDPVLALPAGDYTLTVVGNGATTGAYSFRLLDLSQTQTLTVGTPVSGTLDPASTTAYQFQANAGDSYYFASQQGSNPDYWRLIDPYGNVLFGTTLSNDGGRINLTATGTYTLLIEGDISDTVSSSYGFEAYAVKDTTQALTLDSTVNGSLAVPSQQDNYKFTLSANSLLYFDSLTDNGAFSWTLTGPAGTAVSNRSFTSGNPVLALPAGDYTLTVVGSGQTIGAYSFRLLDLSQAQTLTVGTPVSGTLDPASTTPYQFQGNAGDSYYFASQQGSYPDYWRLIDPYGNVLFGTDLGSDGGRINLTATGTYTLLIESSIGDTGSISYGFEAYTVAHTPQSLTLGSTINGSLAAPSQQDKYTFTLSRDSLLYFDSLTDNGNFLWTLTGPAGTAVSDLSFTSSDGQSISDPVLALPAGDYTLTVAGNGAATGAYSFRLLDLSQAQTLTVGKPVSGTLDPASTTAYQFQANAGDSYYFASQQGSNPDYWRLIDPYGNVLFDTYLSSDGGQVSLTATGAYTLLIEGDISDTAPVNYGFNVQFQGNVPPPAPSGTPLSLGSTVNGDVTTPGQQDTYTFHLSTQSLLYFDSLTNDYNLQWSLTGPAGTAVSGRVFNESDGGSIGGDPVLSLPAGDYTLTVFSPSNATDSYSFRLLDLSQAQPLTVGTPVSGTLDPASTTAYQFHANAGDSYYFASQQGSSPDFWRLIDPYGSVLFGTSLGSDGGRVNLTATGTYTLLIEGDISDTVSSSYGFEVSAVKDTTQSLTLGSTVNGSLAAPTQQDTYNFHLSGGSLLYFDSLTDNDAFQWSLTGPAGTAVSNRPFAHSDGASGPADPVLALPAGDYTLTVVGTGTTTGAYSFRLLDLSQATPITPNTLVSGILNPANSTNSYQFSAAAGNSYYFESNKLVFSLNGVSNADWRLIDPYGNVLFDTSIGSDGGELTVAATGTYTLLIEGASADTGTAAYTLKVDQQGVDVVPSDSSILFKNKTGPVSGVDNPTFHVQFTGDGQTHVFDLQFVGTATGAVLGSIPVTINAEYLYQVQAIDPDGDPLTYELVQAPSGMQIDPSSGLITWIPTQAQLGPNTVTVRVDDGRGGFDLQTYVVNVIDSAPGSIQGTVFSDQNGDGIRNSIPGTSSVGIPPFQPADSPFPVIGVDSEPGFIVTIGPGGSVATTATGQGPYESADDTYIGVVNQADSGVAVQALQVSSDVTPIFGFDSDGINLSGATGYEGPGTYFTDYTVSNPTSGTVVFDDGAGDGLQPGQETYFALEDAPTTIVGKLLKSLPPVSLEPALAGWTVYLDQNHDGKLDPGDPYTRTDALGHYSFSNLVPGTYTVAEVGQTGWQQTAPPGGTYFVVVQSGQVTTVPDFGNQQVATLSPRPPAITSTAPVAGAVGQLYRYNVSVSNPDGVALQFDLPVKPAGMAVDPTTGVIIWTPTSSEVGSQNVILRVRDARGDIALQQFQVDVTGTVLPPYITSTPPQPAVADTQYRYQVQAQDPAGTKLTFRLDQAPTGMAIISGTGLVIWTPTDDQVGSQPIVITVVDAGGAQVSQSFNLQVVGSEANQPPTISSTPRTMVGLGQTYLYAVQASDPDGDPLTGSLTSAPTGMSIDANGLITWTPTAAEFGSNAVIVEVDDGRGGSTTQQFTIQVVSQPVGHPPSITSTAPLSATAGNVYAYNATGNDPDSTPLVWSLDGAPAGMSVDPTQGTIRWTPTADELGSQNVVLRLTNGEGLSVTQSFTVTVYAVSVPPVVSSEPTTQVGVGQLYSYTVHAKDVDGNALTYTLSSGPTGMTIDPTTGLIQWTPTASQVGTQSVVVLIDDGQGGVATQNWNVVVSATPIVYPPTITSNPSLNGTAGQAYTYQVVATDPQSQTLTYSLGQNPTGMTINSSSGLVQWTPDTTQAGAQTVEVIATNQSGLTANQTFSINVIVNQPPVITSSAPTTITAGLNYAYDVQASDADGDPLTYTLTSGPAGMTLDSYGRLRWATGIPNIGNAHVSLTVADNRGASVSQSFDIAVQADTQPPQVQLSISANPADLGSQVTFIVNATDNVGVTALKLTVGGSPVALDSMGRATLTMNNPGDIPIVATATDAAGNVGTDSDTLSVINPLVTNPPTISFDTPADGSVITAPTNIIGTVSDSNLLYYTLSIAPVGSDNFTQIARATSQVNDDVLGQFDPSQLQNGSYELQLYAKNAGGLDSTVDETINVAGGLKLGNFRLSFTALTIPVSGIPITVTRTYDSLDAANSEDFGYGWRLELSNTELTTSVASTDLEDDGIYNPFSDGTRVYVTLPGGTREGFTFHPTLAPGLAGSFLGIYNPSFTPDPGVTDQLSVPTYSLQLNGDGTVYSWGGDLPYNPADSEFGGNYVLTTKDGLAYNINGTTGKLNNVTDNNGNTLTFTDAGISSSAGPQVTFTRDAQGRITSVTDPAGKQITYQYDANGNLTDVTDRDGNTTQFIYGATQPHYLTQVIDPLGRTGVRTNYDAQGRLVTETDAAGKTIQLSYDPSHSTETVTDQLGNPTIYEYDAQGNIVSETNALGGVTTRTYDANNNLLSETNPLGQTTTYTYDSHGNKLTETDPLGHVTQYTYQAIPLISGVRFAVPMIYVQATTTDALGDTTTNSYDSNGNLLSTTDPNGGVTSFTYDASGNPTSITDPDGATTSFVYDNAGHLLQQTDALGHVTSYTYDADGNQLTQTTTLTTPSGLRNLVTSETYDAQGHVLTQKDANGNVTTYQYDAAGNRTAMIDALGNKTAYVYDDRGEQIETINPDGTTTQTQYDADGHVIATIDEQGRKTQDIYDALGRQVETINPDGTTTSTVYDAAGQVTAQVDARGNRTTFQYDAAGNQTAVIDALGDKTVLTYDAANRLVAQTDALGHTTTYLLDSNGHTIETDYADGTKSTVTFDPAGRVAAKTDQDGITTHYQYDALGHLTAVVDALGQRTTYTYDEAGDLISQTDANGHVTHYEYNGVGERTATVLPMGQRSTTTYDGDGNAISTTDYNGATIQYQYNSRNELTETLYPDDTSVSYTYTPSGQRATVTDSRGVTTYTYDTMDRLLSSTTPDGTIISYTYDAAGDRTSVTTPAGKTSYTFDALDRIATVTDPNGGVTRYTYDADGNLTKTVLPNGTSEIRTYDALNRLTYLENDGPSGLISSYRYTLDADGNRIKVVENTGRTVQYTYDALFRLTSESITDPVNSNRTITYTYDAVGNRLSMNDSAQGDTTYRYDANDRMLTSTLNGQVTQYTYDNDGNTLSQVTSPTDETIYKWNAAGQMIEADVTTSSGTTRETYQYDADGNRISTTSNGVVTLYLIDTVQPYAQVLLEYRSGGLIVASYVYGNGLIEQSRSGVLSYYQKDGLGSTTALMNASGVVTDTYVYDAFGRILAQTGNTVNSYLFAGQQRDAATGLDYLRSRYMDPTLGRFLGRDPLNGQISTPDTLQPYMYAKDNPVLFIDPSGKQYDLSSVLSAISIQNTLSTLSLVNTLTFVSRTIDSLDAFFFYGEVAAGLFSLFFDSPIRPGLTLVVASPRSNKLPKFELRTYLGKGSIVDPKAIVMTIAVDYPATSKISLQFRGNLGIDIPFGIDRSLTSFQFGVGYTLFQEKIVNFTIYKVDAVLRYRASLNSARSGITFGFDGTFLNFGKVSLEIYPRLLQGLF